MKKLQILNQQVGFKQTMCESSIRAVQNFIQGSAQIKQQFFCKFKKI
jgi:hypothetical protein